MMQSTMVESGWENFYMLYSFIHTIKGNAVLFKGGMQKMDSLIKCLCARMQNFTCVGAFNFMHILFLKLIKEQSSISANIFPEQRYEYSFLCGKVSTLLLTSKY